MLKVGLIGYGAIGHEHSEAITSTDGLILAAVADPDPGRQQAAQALVPGITCFSDSQDLLNSGSIDLVIVSTPPNSHAAWAREALERDIHVVLEKPMALTAAQCDELITLADERERTLVVYQNRRFDADFVTMRRLIHEESIGDAFHYESFVGGYRRPCDFWHSDAVVSGGAIFDWGSHFIDQILNIFDSPVAHVSGINHKRHWNHVTNADHSTVTMTFDDGRQAMFTNSDLAAVRKPKFYVLGTTGALVGDWDYRAEPDVADLPARLHLHEESGASREVELDSITPHLFHAELAAHILHGAAMQVSAQQSRNVVAVMEAAEESALNHGRPVTPHLI